MACNRVHRIADAFDGYIYMSHYNYDPIIAEPMVELYGYIDVSFSSFSVNTLFRRID